MYDREYNGKTINFEASGGLIHSSLVMQDKETDSYWAIMSGEAIAGEFKGTRLRELPVGEKAAWKDWLAKHPDTEILSVNGREQGVDHYERYFKASDGFRGSHARDKRLKTKEPIFAFHYDGRSYAVQHSDFENGKVYNMGDARLFLHRRAGSEMFVSTTALLSSTGGFSQAEDIWTHDETGCTFDVASGLFQREKESCTQALTGFDTFWYNWSLANPDTELLD